MLLVLLSPFGHRYVQALSRLLFLAEVPARSSSCSATVAQAAWNGRRSNGSPAPGPRSPSSRPRICSGPGACLRASCFRRARRPEPSPACARPSGWSSRRPQRRACIRRTRDCAANPRLIVAAVRQFEVSTFRPLRPPHSARSLRSLLARRYAPCQPARALSPRSSAASQRVC